MKMDRALFWILFVAGVFVCLPLCVVLILLLVADVIELED